ncbi:unnamed protein product [Brachionus calyciflorus]|nr:unnamed protein product [Brachionus calyciflorus]
MGKLRCNWVFLAEIDESFFFLRHRVHAHSRFGEKVPIHFYNESNEMPVSFTWQDLKKGHTLAILYAERKTFLDLSEGIRQEALETCYVFKTGLKNLEEEASKVLDLKDLNFKKSPEKCFSCGVEKESLLRCAKCKLAVYCSKECQVKSWQSVHKNLCSQMDVLLRLASLPRNRKFKKYLSFCPGQDFLSEYVYSERHVQKPLK